jgi:hypothetical protein
VGDSVRDSVWDSVWDSVGDSVWDSVGASVWDSVRASVGASVYGQHESGWMSFYDYFRDACGLTEQTGNLSGLMALSRSAGWALPHKKICWVSERPCLLCRNATGQLHSTDGPALEYPDGWQLWRINGVAVPEWLVMTPAEELNPLDFAKQDNAEVRREFVRKIGVERLCAKLGTTVLDRSADGMYELHLVPLGGATGEWPYLKMRNPSIGVYHMEAVERGCKTVADALRFRNGGEMTHLAPIS